MRKRNIAVVMGLVACAGATAVIHAEETVSGWYGGLGLGRSWLDPDTDGTTFRVEESQSSGHKLFVGYDLNNLWAIEGYYSDQGEATLEPTGSIDYRDFGITGMYYFYQEEAARHGWSAFLRAGIGRMSNDSDVPYERHKNMHVMYGAGLHIPIANNWAARLDVDLYDKDSQLVSLGLIWKFNKRAASPAPEPVQLPEPKPAVAAEPEPAVATQPLPPADSDADGVADGIDQCPDTAMDAKVDDNGCELRPNIVLEGVSFMSASSKLTEASRTVLDKMAGSLKRYPKLQIEVAGYTDSSGSRAANVRLSQQRAESVRDYLIAQEVRPEMLSAKGYGPNDPIADNATAEGRAINRRVELNITEAELPQEPQTELKMETPAEPQPEPQAEPVQE
jgi:OOP family OmpA-OmpF porin